MSNEFEVSVEGFSINRETFDEMSPAAQWYLIQNGFKQSMADCVAGKAKAMRDEGKGEDEIASALADIREARFDAILAGEVSSRAVGPRLKGLDKIAAEYATELLQQAFAKQGRKWPTGKGSADWINERVNALIEKNRAKIYAEAERRMAAKDLDLDIGL